MKLNKTLETTILEAYHEYWDAYLKGDMQTMSYWLHDNIQMIGSGRGEFFDNKKKTIQYYKSTTKQVAGKADMRNRKITVQPVGNEILVNEECDFFVLINSVWTFYGEGRISTLFTKTNKGWKIIQEHGSMPDANTRKGEQVNTNKIKAENVRLKEAVKRRTIELEEKNSELEIETSLERVRTVAMAMKQPDDMLSVCKTISQQMQKLGIKEIRNIQTAIFYEERGSYMNYQFYAKHNKTFITDTVYSDHKIQKAFAAQMLKGKGKFYITHIKGEKKLKKFIAYQKSTNVFIDKHLYTASSLSYYWYSLGPVALGISTYLPLTVEDENLFKRFLNVFELTYRRYLDIEKAEAQAREAQIETSLERVRSRTMAMHQTSELQEVIHTVHKELLHLKLSIDGGSFIVINDDFEKGLRFWGAGGTADTSEEVVLPEFNMPFVTNLAKGIKKRAGFFTEEFSQKEKKEFFAKLFKHEPWSALSSKRKKETLSTPGGYTRSVSVSKHTSIFIINHQGKKFSNAENDILKRFAKVFEQTYIRFLDLQKAEAQARESQIEAAMEKVRSSSLAMHHSKEMQRVVNTVIDQLQKLNIVLDTTNILIFNNKDKLTEFWTGSNSTGEQLTTSWQVPYFNISYYKAIRMAHEKGQEIFSVSYSFKEKNRLFTHLFTHSDFDKLNEDRKKFILKSPRATIAAAIVKDTAIQIISYSRNSFSTEEIEILKRFSRVFNQAYTRFLDLQKAEAQAREAQIQLALERVRARTMAMQKSEELSEAVYILFQQFRELGENPDQTTIGLINEKDWVIEYWVTMYGNQMEKVFKFPIDEPNVTNKIYKAWKAKKKSLVIDLSGKELYAFTHYREKMGGAKYNPDEKRRVFNVAFFSKGLLIVQSNEVCSEESIYLLERFAAVFEQTYTRFLDLQKAEAQAREAQIEAGLERVRSRSMAMHKSDELKDVIRVVLEQFVHLNIKAEHAGFYIDYKVHDEMHIWLADPNLEPFFAILPYFDTPTWNSFLDAKANGKILHTDLLDFNEKNNFYQSLFKLFEIPEEAKKFYMECKGLAVSTVLLDTIGLYIENFSAIPYTDEENEILIRFGKVFQQTYTRFLDLQKAEAQARESQIQLALERVRARTMAMQDSDELRYVVHTFFERLNDLEIQLHTVFLIIFTEGSKDTEWWLMNNRLQEYSKVKVEYNEQKYFHALMEAREKGEEFFSMFMSYEEKNEMLSYLFDHTGFKFTPEEQKKRLLDMKCGAFSVALTKNFAIQLTRYSAKIFSEEENNILKRFTKVFDQSYTRFLDLQKAEAQARESQIQLALERVRARTMAMQKSEELLEVINIFSEQLSNLHISFDNVSFGVNDSGEVFEFWLASSGQPYAVKIKVPYFSHPAPDRVIEAQKQGIKFFADHLTAEENKRWILHLMEYSVLKELPEKVKNYLLTSPGFARSTFILKNINLYIGNYKDISYSPEENEIFKKFAETFEQSYTRFLDLQNAETQVREAQIEAALERVRSRSLAMHKSDELREVIDVVFSNLKDLNISRGSVAIWLFDKQTMNGDFWVATPLHKPEKINLPYDKELMKENTSYKDSWEAFSEGKSYFNRGYSKQQKDRYFNYVFSNNDLSIIPQATRDLILKSDMHSANLVVEKHSTLFFDSWDGVIYDADSIAIFKRISRVFEQAYVRFLDLQKAEAQAREAQIEAGLERVRSRAMAMQTSEELSALIGIVFAELTKLDVNFTRCAILIYESDKKGLRQWMVNSETPSAPMSFYVAHTSLPYLDALMKGWVDRTLKWEYVLEGKDKFVTDEYLLKETELSRLPESVIAGMRTPEKIHISASFNNFGCVTLASLDPLSADNFDILLRFANVFDLTYTRFNDLQVAEARAREAQIEAALERVRGRTMAMQKSDELLPTAEIMFDQLKQLGAELQGVAFAICDKDSTIVQKWTSIGNFSHPFDIEPGEQRMYEAWKNQSGMYEEVYEGEKQKKYYELFMAIPEFRQGLQKIIDLGFPIPTWQKNYAVPFKNGYVLFIVTKPFNETQIFIRFGKVFEQTYTRFLDLQKAEAAAREAIKQAALDRIRADIAAMRTTKDLDRITPLIWNELTILGIPFIRCGVFIMDDEAELIHTFLSTPDGQAITAFHLPYSTPGNISLVLKNWQNNKSYIDHWDENIFMGFAHTLVTQGALSSVDDYMKTFPAGGFYLHFLPFLQGMLYVGNTNKLSDDEINLIQSLADAFSTAYARYEDFNKLEAAKKQVDSTLTELQATQKQLIQSEKMASLGELTAGIAHEIQNPLNFVNNFSEVNAELISELVDEVDKGNTEEVKALANDIKENSEKINHHGKRAGDIVKGMLQHSRTSTGQKEMTDINTLCDEYLRLAYHGLRAKDKSFNAKFETNFDTSIEKINIVPQDIGRVILNLINNAFYAASLNPSEGGTLEPDNKKIPTVWVSTKKEGNKILVSVKDNGNGIPEKIKDKIFQPFFTTKPTGQGTGLGLSLSYDIVKSHAGEIKVESKEGEGSEFVIHLPVV